MENWDPMGGNLIFVIAPPRSGSTLLQKVLASNAEVHTVSEPWIALQPLVALRPNSTRAFYNAEIAREGVEEFLRNLPEGHKAYQEAVRRMLGYLYSRTLELSGKKYFLDKTTRYFHIVPELRAVFPRARFVPMVRNPLAVLSSVLENWVRSEAPGSLREFGADLMLGPQLTLEAALAGAGNLIRYEELAGDPESTVKRICAGIGLEYSAAMVQYGDTEAGQKLFRYGDARTVYEYKRPVTARVDRWVKVVGTSPVWRRWANGYVHALGQELVTALGYDFAELVRITACDGDPRAAWAEATGIRASERET